MDEQKFTTYHQEWNSSTHQWEWVDAHGRPRPIRITFAEGDLVADGDELPDYEHGTNEGADLNEDPEAGWRRAVAEERWALQQEAFDRGRGLDGWNDDPNEYPRGQYRFDDGWDPEDDEAEYE